MIRSIGRGALALWMAFARAVARVNTTLLLFVLYFVAIGITALLGRLFGRRFLEDQPPREGTLWVPRPEVEREIERYRHQF